MHSNSTTSDNDQHILNIKPALWIVGIQWFLRFGITRLTDNDTITSLGIVSGVICGIALIIWWLFFSRAFKSERWMALSIMMVASIISYFLVDKSIQTAFQGFMYLIYSVPLMSMSFVIWAVASRTLQPTRRRFTMILTILITAAVWIFIRSDGMDGSARHRFAWRWAPTPEEKLVIKLKDQMVNKNANPDEMSLIAEWPGFRGPERNGIIQNLKISADWKKNPPKELWRRKIGPGCSSFSISGNYAFTQEQLGELEMVSCYHIRTGNLIWQHGDSARFWDSHAGAGPRSTPAFSNGLIYSQGATGIVNALDARDGRIKWNRDAAKDTDIKILDWGFTGSPLVVDSMVIVAISGTMIAYEALTGEPLWIVKDNGSSYSSPHLLMIDGIPQVLLMSSSRTISVDPATGKTLWMHHWDSPDRILQPAMLSNASLLLTPGMYDISSIAVNYEHRDWSVQENWISSEMKVNFNDMVVHNGYIYGFDGPSIACVDASNGIKQWKGKPYRGWILLLAKQDLMLILTEQGEIALVEANPQKFNEIDKVKAITGKTWSHPAIAGNILLVRNSEEMAAYELPL